MLISLVGMRFHVCVGILPHEREYPQALEIDLRVKRSDTADGVLDYRRLYELASQRVAKQPLEYLEDIAISLADGAMTLPGVTGARVAIRKPQVLVGGPLAYAEVVVARGDD